MTTVTEAHLHEVLQGLSYPIMRDDIVHLATENGASDDVVGMLEVLPDRQYNTEQEIMSEIGPLTSMREDNVMNQDSDIDSTPDALI